MAGAIEGPVNYNWHIADNVLVGSKVRYLSNFSVAPHFGERPESALPHRSSWLPRRTAVHPTSSFARVIMGVGLGA